MLKPLALALTLVISPARSSTPDTIPLLVSAAWLREHASDPDVVLLHVGFNRREFARTHMPGARFVWYERVAPSNPDASTESPEKATLETLLEGLGVSDRSRIVLTYSDRSLWLTARALWTLELFGMTGRVAILEGGNEAWKAAGFPFDTTIAIPSRGSLTLTFDPARLATAESILASLNDSTIALVDARARSSYDGTADQFRSGHIPGARSMPMPSLTDSLGRLKDPERLREQFVGAEVDTTKPIVVYCVVGQAASVTYLAARRLGYQVALYDGSYQDWNLRGPEFPVVPPPPPRPQ